MSPQDFNDNRQPKRWAFPAWVRAYGKLVVGAGLGAAATATLSGLGRAGHVLVRPYQDHTLVVQLATDQQSALKLLRNQSEDLSALRFELQRHVQQTAVQQADWAQWRREQDAFRTRVLNYLDTRRTAQASTTSISTPTQNHLSYAPHH